MQSEDDPAGRRVTGEALRPGLAWFGGGASSPSRGSSSPAGRGLGGQWRAQDSGQWRLGGFVTLPTTRHLLFELRPPPTSPAHTHTQLRALLNLGDSTAKLLWNIPESPEACASLITSEFKIRKEDAKEPVFDRPPLHGSKLAASLTPNLPSVRNF